MKKNLLLIALVVYLCVAPNFAQTRKNTNPSFVKAFAAAENGKSPEIKRPTEETFGIWNEFSSEKHGFTVVFPASSAQIWRTEQGKIASFEAETEKAHYGVMRMKFPALLDPRQLDILGESLFAQSYDAKTTRLISEKNVCLDGVSGKELIYEEAGKIFFTRFYIMEQKIFMLSVSLPQAEYTKDFDYWAMKFLDSFGAKRDAGYVG
jgi:hypothetical protein